MASAKAADMFVSDILRIVDKVSGSPEDSPWSSQLNRGSGHSCVPPADLDLLLTYADSLSFSRSKAAHVVPAGRGINSGDELCVSADDRTKSVDHSSPGDLRSPGPERGPQLETSHKLTDLENTSQQFLHSLDVLSENFTQTLPPSPAQVALRRSPDPGNKYAGFSNCLPTQQDDNSTQLAQNFTDPQLHTACYPCTQTNPPCRPDSARGWPASRFVGDQSVYSRQRSRVNYAPYPSHKTGDSTPQSGEHYRRQDGYGVCHPEHSLVPKPLSLPEPSPTGHWSTDSPPSQTSSQSSPGISTASGSLSPSLDGESSERANSSCDSGVDANTPPLDIDANPDMDSPDKVRKCQICNDGASGFHYGVWSCEGCKAFFKRSLQGPVDYICPATNNCTIDKHRRKSCQACRLRKCVQMGMSRGACREKKQYRQYQKHGKRKAEQNLQCDVIPAKQTKFSANTSSNLSSEVPRPINIKKERHLSSDVPLCEGPMDNHVTQVPPPERDQSGGELAAPPSMPHPLVQHLLRIEREERLAEQRDLRPDTPLSDLILPLVDSELRDIVSWAKEVPGYMNLLLTERMELMEQSWTEVILFGLIFRSTAHHNVLRFAPNLQLSEEYTRNDDLWPICKQALVLVNSFKQLTIRQEEAVLLRACLLFNAGVHNLGSESRFQRVQENVLEALQHTVLGQFGQNVIRITRLLLLLPQLRQLGLIFNRTLVRLQQQGRLPASCKLIGELLKTSANYHSTV